VIKQDFTHRWTNCPICCGQFIHYVFSLSGHRIVKCGNCGLMGINPQPSDQVLKDIYNENYFLLSQTQEGEDHSRSLKHSTAQLYLDLLERYMGQFGRSLQGAQLLEVGIGFGDFLLAAQARGCEITGVEYSEAALQRARLRLGTSVPLIHGEISALPSSARFDIIVFIDVIEHVPDPLEFLKKAYGALRDDGVIFCVFPSLDSRTAKVQGVDWAEFKLEHLYYFDDANARRLITKSGFTDIVTEFARKTLSLRYIAAHFEVFQHHYWTSLLRLFGKIFPSPVLNYPFNIVVSGTALIAKKMADPHGNFKLSVIMAVYNEVATVRAAIEGVLAKSICCCDIDLVIVESNSTDGSRDVVEEFRKYPMVCIIHEDRPMGKGHAVRQGMKVAQGDIVLIQDADVEYDFEDYDALVESFRDGGQTFVLGSRHGGEKWKLRHFEGQAVTSFLVNTVHWILTFAINLLFGVRLTDPFTMFKVFRRSAVQGLTFHCNRFDFDIELLLKLIRKGHRPIEVPVNYSARSFEEGKKVRFFRDPPTWVWAILKYRFTKI
jgi:2-polyprenyl-3-methyl-5-hydroxy-6-metoxy-1,4-benzoquinol methylase